MDLHKAASMQQLHDVDKQSIHIVLKKRIIHLRPPPTEQRSSTLRQLPFPSGDQRRVVLIYLATNLLLYFFNDLLFDMQEDLLWLLRLCRCFLPSMGYQHIIEPRYGKNIANQSSDFYIKGS